MNNRIIAIGDIHGCSLTFEKLLGQLNPLKSDKVILLGDYIDRGPYIKEVIEKIIQLRQDGYDIVTLMGNHESMLLDSIRDARSYALWMYNGGEETLKSFGVHSARDLKKEYLDFFRSLYYYYQIDNYLFVHAGFSEQTDDFFEDKPAMLWSRKESYCHLFFKDKFIIHGHTPINYSTLEETIKNKSNVINIDTGCVYSFRDNLRSLTALEIPSFKIISENNIDID